MTIQPSDIGQPVLRRKYAVRSRIFGYIVVPGEIRRDCVYESNLDSVSGSKVNHLAM
jgi:hypothetical protein